MAKSNSLKGAEVVSAAELERRRKRAPKRAQGSATGRTQKKRTPRKAAPVPKGVETLEDLDQIDDDDPELKYTDTRPRSRMNAKSETAHDDFRQDKQRRANARRAKIRKHEAKVEVVRKQNPEMVKANHSTVEVVENDLIVGGAIDLDDWDDTELIRGYRRNRDGKFGAPPKYIPREVQNETFRRLLRRGESKMREAYLQTVEGLVALARGAESEKVRLDAQKELMDRLVGKVPDKLKITAQEEPWQEFLADAVAPMGDTIGSLTEPEESAIADDGGRGRALPAADSGDAGDLRHDAPPDPDPYLGGQDQNA